MSNIQQKQRRSMGFGNVPLRPDELPPDLRRKVIQDYSYTEESIEQKALESIEAAASINALTRGLYGRSITVGLTPTLVVRAERLRSYLFKNPESSIGLVSESTIRALAPASTSGSTQATPLDVSSYRDAHLFVDCTDINGASPELRIYTQAQDPASGNWTDIQQVFAIGVIGTYYEHIGVFGVTSNLALRWEIWPLGTSNATFSIGAVLKDGLLRSAAEGNTQAIYLGPEGVKAEIGYPLLEGQERVFYMKENVELYAVGKTTGLELKVFEL